MRHGHENLALDLAGVKKEQSYSVHLEVEEYETRSEIISCVIRMHWWKTGNKKI